MCVSKPRRSCLALGIKSQVITACQVRELQRRGEDRRYAHEAQIAEERGKRLKAREWLHFLEHLYDQDSERLSQLRRGSPGQFPGEEEACWEFMSEMLPAIRRAETNYRRIAELKAGRVLQETDLSVSQRPK